MFVGTAIASRTSSASGTSRRQRRGRPGRPRGDQEGRDVPDHDHDRRSSDARPRPVRQQPVTRRRGRQRPDVHRPRREPDRHGRGEGREPTSDRDDDGHDAIAPATAGRAARSAVSTDLDDLPGDALPGDRAQAAADVADVATVPHPAVHVAEHAAGQRGVEELRAVVRRDRRRAAATSRRDRARPGVHRQAQQTVVTRGDRRRPPRSGPALIERSPSRNGPVPSRQTRTARIASATAESGSPPRTLAHGRFIEPPPVSTRAIWPAVRSQPVKVPPAQPRSRAQPPAQLGVDQPAAQRGRERRGVSGATSRPGRCPSGAQPSASGTPPTAVAMTGSPSRQRLGHDHAVGLPARRQHEQVGCGVGVVELPAGPRPDEVAPGRRSRRSPLADAAARRTPGRGRGRRRRRSATAGPRPPPAPRAARRGPCRASPPRRRAARRPPVVPGAIGAGSTPGSATCTRSGDRA